MMALGILGCAQRLSTSSEFSPQNSLPRHDLNWCSTPFDIIGILTCARYWPTICCCLCSTPFDIIGILTMVGLRQTKKNRCAQRLSTSSEFSLTNASLYSFSDALCSTPFDIIGILTNQLCDTCNAHWVLNAFRHHRNSHPYCRDMEWVRCSVLNAFRHHRNSHLMRLHSQIKILGCLP